MDPEAIVKAIEQHGAAVEARLVELEGKLDDADKERSALEKKLNVMRVTGNQRELAADTTKENVASASIVSGGMPSVSAT